MAFGLNNLNKDRTPAGFSGITSQPSQNTAALMFMRQLQETERWRELQKFYAFYEGTHWSFIREVAEQTLTINYSRAFVDKSAEWLFAKGFGIQTLEGESNGTPEIEVLNEIWQYNQQELLGIQLGTEGGIAGDAFLKITWLPDVQKVALVKLDTESCFPIWDPNDPNKFKAFKIEYILYSGLANGDYNDVRLYTELYTEDGQIEISIDGRPIDEYPNPFGFIPIIHFKNKWKPRSYYGLSDLYDIIPLNREYNEQMTKIKDIINYHSEPVTLVFGAQSNKFVKGARKVWGGLPKDARVENLALNADLTEARNHAQTIKEAMHELSCVPINSLGQEQQISNTSNAALQTQYLPLIGLTNRKQITYGAGIEQANFYILTIYEMCTHGKPGHVHVDPTIPLIANWPSPLPKDLERLLGEVLTPQAALELLDREDALTQIGYKNPKKMLEKIDADRVAKAKVDAQVTTITQQPELDMQSKLQAQQAQESQNPTDQSKENQTTGQGVVS